MLLWKTKIWNNYKHWPPPSSIPWPSCTSAKLSPHALSTPPLTPSWHRNSWPSASPWGLAAVPLCVAGQILWGLDVPVGPSQNPHHLLLLINLLLPRHHLHLLFLFLVHHLLPLGGFTERNVDVSLIICIVSFIKTNQRCIQTWRSESFSARSVPTKWNWSRLNN